MGFGFGAQEFRAPLKDLWGSRVLGSWVIWGGGSF